MTVDRDAGRLLAAQVHTTLLMDLLPSAGDGHLERSLWRSLAEYARATGGDWEGIDRQGRMAMGLARREPRRTRRWRWCGWSRAGAPR